MCSNFVCFLLSGDVPVEPPCQECIALVKKNEVREIKRINGQLATKKVVIYKTHCVLKI